MTQTDVDTEADEPRRPRTGAATVPSGPARAKPPVSQRFASWGRDALPGLAFVAVCTGLSMLIGQFTPTVSPLLIAIVLGALIANIVPLPQRIEPGLTFSAKRLLRVGVALLGLQLVVGDILDLGWGVIGLIVAVVGLGIVFGMWVGKLMGLTWTQRLLIACGFSICGAAAVAAADGVVDAEEEETITAIALVVIFGTLMILVIPLLTDLIGITDEQGGMWAGASIHEVAQVVAAGGAIGGGALAIAVVVKLGRVLMLAPVLTAIGLMRRRADKVRLAAGGTDAETVSDPAAVKRPPLVPLFVVMFIVFVAISSTGILPDGVLSVGKTVETALLTAAMFALGTGVRVATMKKVGHKPFVLATIQTVFVAALALGGVLILT
ncbi:YeiH family protein [Tomitella fengzijianii]|uniref:Putative sulfate exporter family transporter n=1 Tax=Tomitella fengzijianii TaxID=2597660 RepID=A0A516X638_9ACTN|nr:putative sulfate exporter family transporter [Tomitella fengzijianii]QDQ98532.1 putative sulfate exporter family transporter [Tomitella fengzijianii]